VLVQVTPHINAGGLVTLEVQAEVSNPGNPRRSDPPPINTFGADEHRGALGQTIWLMGVILDGDQTTPPAAPRVRIPVFGGCSGPRR